MIKTIKYLICNYMHTDETKWEKKLKGTVFNEREMRKEK